jgi:hypothetical protein
MKLTDFGLWFDYWEDGELVSWSKQPPSTRYEFNINYHGLCLGYQLYDYGVTIFDSEPYLIKLNTLRIPHGNTYLFNRLLTLDDFEIIPNPKYKGDL